MSVWEARRALQIPSSITPTQGLWGNGGRGRSQDPLPLLFPARPLYREAHPYLCLHALPQVQLLFISPAQPVPPSKRCTLGPNSLFGTSPGCSRGTAKPPPHLICLQSGSPLVFLVSVNGPTLHPSRQASKVGTLSPGPAPQQGLLISPPTYLSGPPRSLPFHCPVSPPNYCNLIPGRPSLFLALLPPLQSVLQYDQQPTDLQSCKPYHMTFSLISLKGFSLLPRQNPEPLPPISGHDCPHPSSHIQAAPGGCCQCRSLYPQLPLRPCCS